MTLNGVMAVTLRYFTEFGEPVFQPRRSLHGRILPPQICIPKSAYRYADHSVQEAHILGQTFTVVKQQLIKSQNYQNM